MRKVMGGAMALALCLSAGGAAAQSDDAVRIPHEKFQLQNGMTVIFHEDHSQPMVVVNINVNVGSRDEPERRTGFAHLFEHLMFMGTERVPEKMYDAWMEAEGAWNNAWTAEDRTDYFDVGPSHTLALLLWLEADRFSALGGQIDQDKLDAQRGVVQNERRQQVENTPYGVAELRLPELIFPVGHPYHHPVIGSHADLEAASVADVKAFFDEHYVAPNLSLVVAGDFKPADVKPIIERMFGSLPAAELVERRTGTAKAGIANAVRETLEDNVSAPKVYLSYSSPALYAPGDAELDLLSAIMDSGKASRLYKSLVYDQKIAQSVSAYQSSMKLTSHFTIEVVAVPGVALDTIEKAVDLELDKLRNEKVTQAELDRAKNQYEASFVTRMQSLSTRASLLNNYQAALNDPGYAGRDLARYLRATPDDLLKMAKQTFDPTKRVILHVVPKAKEGGQP